MYANFSITKKIKSILSLPILILIYIILFNFAFLLINSFFNCKKNNVPKEVLNSPFFLIYYIYYMWTPIQLLIGFLCAIFMTLGTEFLFYKQIKMISNNYNIFNFDKIFYYFRNIFNDNKQKKNINQINKNNKKQKINLKNKLNNANQIKKNKKKIKILLLIIIK